MISNLLTQEVTIVRRSPSGQRDAYGNESQTETETVVRGELQQQARRADAEPEDQGEFSDTTWKLFLPAGTEIDTGDLVVVDGRRFEMFGAPWSVHNPRTRSVSHVEANVRATAGAED